MENNFVSKFTKKMLHVSTNSTGKKCSSISLRYSDIYLKGLKMTTKRFWQYTLAQGLLTNENQNTGCWYVKMFTVNRKEHKRDAVNERGCKDRNFGTLLAT